MKMKSPFLKKGLSRSRSLLLTTYCIGAMQPKSSSICCRQDCLLEGVQLRPVQVLRAGVAQQVVTLGLPDDRRDDRRARMLRGARNGARP